MTPAPRPALTEKQQWILATYDALRPEGQAAVDLALQALPRQALPAR
jgi:hypothetical protein